VVCRNFYTCKNFRQNRYKQDCKPLSGGFRDQINTQRPEYFACLAVDITLAGSNMMTVLTSKQENEQAAFARFARSMEMESVWLSVSSRPEPEPDLLCVHASDGAIAFELVSLTDPTIAQVQAAGPRARQDAFSTSDPSERIIRNKLRKKYTTTAKRIELLVYTDGQILTPDDVIIPTIFPWLDAATHPFSCVWFMGERTTCRLWNAS